MMSTGCSCESILLESRIYSDGRRRGQIAWTIARTEAPMPNNGPGKLLLRWNFSPDAGVAELADAQDLKSWVPQGACGFETRPRHFLFKELCVWSGVRRFRESADCPWNCPCLG